MNLLITDPLSIVVKHDDVDSLRARDASGSFGILAGHADLLTVLIPSVLSWRHHDGRVGYCAVRRGVLTVTNGDAIAVATRQAQVGEDLQTLEGAVRSRLQADTEAGRASRVAALRLNTQAIRRIVEALRAVEGRTFSHDP